MNQVALWDNAFSLSYLQKWTLLILSFIIVAFGQPAWSNELSFFSAIVGFSCFLRVLLALPNAKARFWTGMSWYACVQLIQLSWFFTHPFFYIYAVTVFCAVLMGFQWGLLSICIKPRSFNHFTHLFALAGLWTLLEWSRLFILSGLPFNPIGLTLSNSLYSLQLASLGGIYGMSFWVILTNLFFLRAWIDVKSYIKWGAAIFIALIPYAFGWWHLSMHDQNFEQDSRRLNVVLVQSALPIEESMKFQSAQEAREFVLDEWRHIFSTLNKQVGQKIDLIVLPENIVPYGTFHHIFPAEEIYSIFQEIFKSEIAFPTPESSSYIDLFDTDRGEKWLVSNAYLAQTLANLFHAHVIIGLEDSGYVNLQKAESYSSAFHFIPQSNQLPARYAKRILVPMGEYIPFEWCRAMAAKYGVTGSYACGSSAQIFQAPIPIGASICYEEMYGNLMRENRLKGAELLVNLTNDGWYPQSRLPKQHFDHARLRTVENGIPSVRACNTGLTAGIDSLGRIVGMLENESFLSQNNPDSILLNVPLYHYDTLYTQYGDLPILAISCLSLLFFAMRKIKNKCS